jgi:multidrug transporter EmrE-like cation transporter
VIPYLAVYVVLSTAGVLLLRSRLGTGAGLATLASDPRLLIGAVCYAASFLTWLAALRHFEITRAFPVFLGTSYAAVSVGAVLILGERVTAARLSGLALVGVGIILIGR